MSLTTLAKAKEWLQIPTAQTTDDALLTRLIDSASGFIESWLSRKGNFATASYTDKRDGTGGDIISLSNYPVTAISSLSVDGVVIAASPDGGVLQTGYGFDSNNLWLSGFIFTRGRRNVAIAYTAGYTSVPSEIENACIEIIGERYRTRDRIGHVSKSLGGETVAFSQKDMSDHLKTTLQQYKRVVPL